LVLKSSRLVNFLGERSKAEKDLLQRPEMQKTHSTQGYTVQEGQRFCFCSRWL